MTHSRAAKCYFASVVVILVLTAAAKIVSAAGSAGVLKAQDRLIPISNRTLLLTVAPIEILVAVTLLLAEAEIIKSASVVWLSVCFGTYRFGLMCLGHIWVCPCLGFITQKLPFRPESIDAALKLTLGYMFAGSAYFLISSWRRQRER